MEKNHFPIFLILIFYLLSLFWNGLFQNEYYFLLDCSFSLVIDSIVSLKIIIFSLGCFFITWIAFSNLLEEEFNNSFLVFTWLNHSFAYFDLIPP